MASMGVHKSLSCNFSISETLTIHVQNNTPFVDMPKVISRIYTNFKLNHKSGVYL